MNPFSPLIIPGMTLYAFAVCMLFNRIKPVKTVTGHYRSIDGLRGYLAFFVFLHHASIWFQLVHTGEWKDPPSSLFTQLGQGSVALFFMITSFLFYGKVLDNQRGEIDWPKFFAGRVFRLAPLYLICVLVMMTLTVFSSHEGLVDSPSYILKCVIEWMLFAIPGAPDVNRVSWMRFTSGVQWSLAYEWYFYLSMPLVALFGRIRVPKCYILIGLITLAFAVAIHANGLFVVVFLYGMIAAHLVRVPVFKVFASTKFASVIILVCIGLLIKYFATAYGPVQLLLLGISFALIAGGADLFSLLTKKTSRLFGDLSYSIYLLHGILLFLTLIYGVGIENIKEFSAFQYWCIVFALVPVLLTIALFTFSFIEEPAMQLAPRFVKFLRNRPRQLVMRLTDPLIDKSERNHEGPIF